jgi:hypothetical protein
MKRKFLTLLAAFTSSVFAFQSHAQLPSEALAALQKPIKAERKEDVAAVPITWAMGKLAVTASLNGAEHQFIFDTGSPTMISRELADQLDLVILGSNTGRDANGRAFTTDIAVVDRLTIGSVTFRAVPVLIADFSVSDPDKCFFDGGVIGSELFPGLVWHIDLSSQSLKIAGRYDDLLAAGIAETTAATRLHDFGYPHAPIFDYAIGAFTDKGLFDTGNSDTVTLFERIMSDDEVQAAIVSKSLRQGRGTHGVSAAGLGKASDLLRFDIDGVALGGTPLGRRRGATRNVPPTLIGLGILSDHSVTLDYPGQRLRLHPRSDEQTVAAHPGFGLMFTGGAVRVAQIFDGSAAQKAGLKLGDLVTKIDGEAVPPADAPCAVHRRLIEGRAAQMATSLTLLRDGEQVEIDLIQQ